MFFKGKNKTFAMNIFLLAFNIVTPDRLVSSRGYHICPSAVFFGDAVDLIYSEKAVPLSREIRIPLAAI